ncbi:hypothetical protein CDD82_6220 [Ophiocordyceps australis]|uniref:RNA polymerase I-specific transcription initiation factor RRN3 n=1 Tax=Ophiocordyceps australis TaxID=1399860 RepID=A0A2C5YWU9_9HYPO|nr:hypothetical protein CDD82_6220 [Ophiocordyceps australis]
MLPLTPRPPQASSPAGTTVTPVRSILKASSALGKRKMVHVQQDQDETPMTAEKRRKVLFDDVRNVAHQVGDRCMDDFRLEVRKALEEHLRGEDEEYHLLMSFFANDKQRYLPPVVGQADDTLQPHELQSYVTALTSCMPILKDKECAGLVKQILQCSWLGRDYAFVKAYTHFLEALISAQGSYLNAVLSMLVAKFCDSACRAWTVPDFPEVSRDEMRRRLHLTIQYLLHMFPAALDGFGNALAANFPFSGDSVRTHIAYVRNLLLVKDYVPSLQNEILDLVVGRVLSVDSKMQTDLEDAEDDMTAAVQYSLQEKREHMSDWEEDEFNEDSDADSIHSDDTDFDAVGVKIKMIGDDVEKMDAMLDKLFAFYTPFFANPGSDKAFDMFTVILGQFEHLVLPTLKSRHTQFLVFHFAQMDERLMDAFSGQLISAMFRSNTPHVVRQAAAAYLASFAARGARVPASFVRTLFMVLMHHLDRYRQQFEPACAGPNLWRYHAYYSLLQATLYIFCFRWQDLVVSAPSTVDPQDAASYIGQHLEWVDGCNRELSVHIFGKLNPLKVCTPMVVDEFARLAHGLNFLYIYPLLERNKRIDLAHLLSARYSTGGALRDVGGEQVDESSHQLEPYFPFDPYQLPVSKRWLQGDYVAYKSIIGLNADAQDESDEADCGGDSDAVIEETDESDES